MRKPSKTLRAPNQEDAFSVVDLAVLTRCRCIAIEYARAHNIVTAAHIGRLEPAFHDIHLKAQGQLFRVKRLFEKVGYTTSSSPKRKGGMISVWKIKNERAAREFLQEANMEQR
jgi:hypothetical protein